MAWGEWTTRPAAIRRGSRRVRRGSLRLVGGGSLGICEEIHNRPALLEQAGGSIERPAWIGPRDRHVGCHATGVTQQPAAVREIRPGRRGILIEYPAPGGDPACRGQLEHEAITQGKWCLRDSLAEGRS